MADSRMSATIFGVAGRIALGAIHQNIVRHTYLSTYEMRTPRDCQLRPRPQERQFLVHHRLHAVKLSYIYFKCTGHAPVYTSFEQDLALGELLWHLR